MILMGEYDEQCMLGRICRRGKDLLYSGTGFGLSAVIRLTVITVFHRVLLSARPYQYE